MKPCRTYCLGCLVMAVWFCLADTATAQNFTLEQVMSSPFPSEPTVSKRGDKIAWVFDAEGKRNLWIAEAPTFAAHQLTHYDNDDGQELSELVFSPNATLIAYVRGGGIRTGCARIMREQTFSISI